MPESLATQLDKLGIPYTTYDGTDADRLEKSNAVEDVQFSLRDSSGNEITLGTDEVQKNKKYVANMEPVVVLTGNPMAKESGVDFYTAGTAYFQSIGGSAKNEVLDTVVLNDKGIRHLINRKLTWRKTALLRVVKPVIEQGRILHVENDHNNKDTAVIGAVVQLDGQNYYMGVVVSQNDQRNNQYELHDAVIVQIEKKSADALTKTPSAEKNQTRRGIGNSSIAIILSDLANYNTKFAGEEQFSSRDLPDTVSIREYLGELQQTSRMTETEKVLLGRYQTKLKALQEKEQQVTEQEKLLKEVHGEWGFDGYTITDNALEPYMCGRSIALGTDKLMLLPGNNRSAELNKEALLNDSTLFAGIREAVHRILYTFVNSKAMSGVSTNIEVVTVTPWWQTALIDINIILSCLTLLGLIGMLAGSDVAKRRQAK